MSDPLRPYHDFSAEPQDDASGVRRAPRPQAEDPLAELARILGEGTAHPVRPEHVVEVGRRVLPSKRAPQQISDLEAELFESLRSSVAPEERVRGTFEREAPPIIPQHPVDDHDIASLRSVTAGEAAEVAPASVAEDPRDPRLADYYAYDDGVAAGSYDPAFGQPSAHAVDLDEAFAAEIHRAREGRVPEPTFADFDTDAIAAAAREASPYVADDSMIRPHSPLEEHAAGLLPREGGGGLKVAVFVVGALLMGGGALAGWKYLGGASTRGPVVVHADGKPLKVVPDPSKTTPPTGDGEVSLKRDVKVDGSKIVSLQEDPVEHVAGRTADGREVRVINPGAQRPASADQPRTVKTVVVRPDGSIVSEDGAPVAPPAAPTPAPAAAPTPAAPASTAPIIARTVTTPIIAPPVPTLPTTPAAPATAPVAATPEAVPTIPATPVPIPAPAPVRPPVAATTAPAKPVVTTPVRAPAPTAATAPTHLVTTTPVKPTPGRTENGAPMALGPVAPRLAPPTQAERPPQAVASAPTTIAPPSGGSGDWAVQLSASKSEADARSSYAAAQRRFSALAGRSVEVQRADLGAKGTFYRAKVPAGSRDAAAALCGQIKAQGGDCMVTRR